MTPQTRQKTTTTDIQVNRLSFIEHLDELKVSILKSLIAIVICACVSYIFGDQILAVFLRPVGQLVFTKPSEAFMAYITLSLISGVILALPIIFYQGWKFLWVAFKDKERKFIKLYGPLSFMLFCVGAGFAFFIILPICMQFLLGFSSSVVVPMITVNNYISFVGTLCLAFGVIFEMPLIIAFLTKIGIATPAFLQQKRKHAIVLLFIISAVITPPDYITQIMLAIPLVALYEISIIFSKLIYKSKESFE